MEDLKEKPLSTQTSTKHSDRVTELSEHTPEKQIEETNIGVLDPMKIKMVVMEEETPLKVSAPKRKRNRRQRMDVVFKTILRTIRRHYTKIFKANYPQSRRLSHRPTISVQIEIMKAFCKENFSEEEYSEELVFFVMGLIKNKLFST